MSREMRNDVLKSGTTLNFVERFAEGRNGRCWDFQSCLYDLC